MTPAWIPAIAAVIATAVLPGVVFGQGKAESRLRKITVEDGRELVSILLQPTGCTKDKCTFSRIENAYFPQFYFYYVTWPNPVGSPHIGTWAVDPATADVWDADACIEYRSATLTKFQALLRKRIGLTERAYMRLKQRPPMCESDEKVTISTGRF